MFLLPFRLTVQQFDRLNNIASNDGVTKVMWYHFNFYGTGSRQTWRKKIEIFATLNWDVITASAVQLQSIVQVWFKVTEKKYNGCSTIIYKNISFEWLFIDGMTHLLYFSVHLTWIDVWLPFVHGLLSYHARFYYSRHVPFWEYLS